MIKHVFGTVAAALLLGLGACNSAGGGGGAIEPGEWETIAELTRVDISNLPEELRRDMRMPSSRTTTTRGCWVMTADRVRIENLRFTIPEPMMRGAGCTMPELVLEGGTLRGRMSCTGFPAPATAGGARTMSVSGELDGSYTPNSVQATTRGEIRLGDRSGSAEIRITSRRLGACPPPPPRYVPPVYAPAPDDGQATRDLMNEAQSARDAVNQASEEARGAFNRTGR